MKHQRHSALKAAPLGVAVLAVGLAISAVACTQQTGSPTAHGTAPAATPTAPRPTVSESASPSHTVPSLSGTVYYLSPGHTGTTFADKVTLYSRRGSEAPKQLGTFSADGGRIFEMTVTVSPDGRRLAWLDSHHQLVTSTVSGSDNRVLSPNVPTALCALPIWTPDSKQIIFPGSVDGFAQIVNVDGTGMRQVKTPYPCSHVSLQDGKRLAWTTYEGVSPGQKPNLVIGNLSTGETQRFRLQQDVFKLVTISPDAKRAVVVITPPSSGGNGPGAATPDPAEVAKQQRYASYPERRTDGDLIDVTTGALLPAPVPGDIIDAAFQQDGTLFLRSVEAGTYWVSLLSTDGTVLARTAEPADYSKYGMLAYVP